MGVVRSGTAGGGAGGSVLGAQGSRGGLSLAGRRSFHNVHTLLCLWEKFWVLVDCREGCFFPLKCFVSET